MADSFVPRLQLNTSRNSAGSGYGSASYVNRTATPCAAPLLCNASKRATEFDDGGRRYSVFSAPNSNNNTSLTNYTSSSDWLRDSFARGRDGATAAETLSPIPRMSESAIARGGGWVGARPRCAGQEFGGGGSFDGHRHSSDSCSRGVPGFSASRLLFISLSASLPRDRNLVVGNTGRVAWTGSAGVSGGEKATEGYSSSRSRSCHAESSFVPAHWGQSSRNPVALSTVRPAFTSTYVGITSGAMPTSKQNYTRQGVDMPDVHGPEARATAGDAFHWGGDTRGDGAAGLVNSRSRVRADRWTDEEPCEGARNKGRSIGDDAAMIATDTSSTSFEEERRRSRQRRRHRRGPRHWDSGCSGGKGSGGRPDKSYSVDDAGSTSERDSVEDDPLSLADAIVCAMDAQPVVPPELLQNAQESPFMWNRHPSHGVVLCLLQQRGIYLPRYRELVDYHMAELFLAYLDLCREGAFFVYYAAGKWPKERFFRIRMLTANRLEATTEQMPHLTIALHERSAHILDAIPLNNLVGVTVTPQSACFRRFLESPNTIIGCREGRGHRARLPVDGAFSLWFYDTSQHMPRSLDILTCDAKVFDIWTKTFRGLVSVNSTSVVQVALTPHGESVRLAELARAAQQQAGA
ncbi:hypothetical protein GH5_02439 [Leishmania sp. Ghana 2012 LV757]|uniref:hypothetical protein n=1 Tax=Leishmania sp. Ghana 2012 LV757 TaxID=2803181 RepID=UPI001B4A4923|nr:hypothetical protein GH5_02439 [Leishmania sp. Ghana 2012 LV757]